MDVSPEHLVEQARERFQLQDYYGAIHLLEEVVTTGRAFADAHHMLGLSYSLVGQPEQALAQLGRALDAREQFEIIVRARPAYLDAAAMLGLACYLAGDGLAAKAVWEACRERRPEDPRVEAYLAMLERNDTAAPAPAATTAAGDPPPAATGRSGRKKKS